MLWQLDLVTNNIEARFSNYPDLVVGFMTGEVITL